MCSLIDILQWKKNQKDSDDFWRRKLTLKVKFWYFLTAPHYSNCQNLVISFEYSWFLAKNLSNFVSLPWKLYNRKCHNGNIMSGPQGLEYPYVQFDFTYLKTLSTSISTMISARHFPSGIFGIEVLAFLFLSTWSKRVRNFRLV